MNEEKTGKIDKTKKECLKFYSYPRKIEIRFMLLRVNFFPLTKS